VRPRPPSVTVLTEAHRLGFGVAAIFAVVGVVAALILLRRSGDGSGETVPDDRVAAATE
jgi:hypothetical protein